ncbi:hypothetical protein DID88_007001 [Monilinia fructigena]|uniref:GEgh 16 protein n=1 Tax=Monilinia fructigena TaxID=38457 RepID=A0A395IIK6_9HELO|nr:hypothetical protein DID88_007001 [Monilinia fructigena]
MRYSIAIVAIIPLVAAHGKIAVMTGDMGGNTTGLGIQGAVIPGAGTNKQTEVDTTVFNSKNAATDGLGKTKAGPNTMAGMKAVMAQSGDTLPQVSDGGDLSGTIHIVTTDGAGPYSAIVDPTGTGAFSQGTQAKVTTQMGIVKRAKNVNEDYQLRSKCQPACLALVPVAGKSGVCMVKIANPSGAGPFGGVAAFQMASTDSASTASTGAANGTAAATEATTEATTEKSNKPSNVGASEGSNGLEGKVVNSFKTGALGAGVDGEHKRSNSLSAGAFKGDIGFEGKVQAGAFEGEGAKRSIGAKFRA